MNNAAPKLGGAMQLQSAHGYLDRVIVELRAQGGDHRAALVAVFEYLSNHIRRMRDELGALRPAGVGPASLNSTKDELEEVIAETGKAANEILSAAEDIERLAADMPPEQAEAITAAVTRIYIASSFQDITGQRIAKVVAALQFIESKISALVQDCESEPSAAPHADGESLLNGPQLAIKANAQDAIDRLFDMVEDSHDSASAGHSAG